MELDLVEISPKADPPVCKIVDYKKFLYHHKKKQKEIKAKTAKIVVKEIRFGPNNRFRVFYRVHPSAGEVHILAIGTKVRNRLMVGGEEFEL